MELQRNLKGVSALYHISHKMFRCNYLLYIYKNIFKYYTLSCRSNVLILLFMLCTHLYLSVFTDDFHYLRFNVKQQHHIVLTV